VGKVFFLPTFLIKKVVIKQTNLMKPEPIKKTSWHRLLAKLLELLLSPVNIDVHHDMGVMTAPPEVDILLFSRFEFFFKKLKSRLKFF
jgi:hypothetical protein